MRIVAVADTHLFQHELRVPDGDVFIHAGDLCSAGTLGELALAVRWLQRLPHRVKLIVAGNHDWPFQRQGEDARRLLGEGLTYLQDSGVELEGVRFWGSPWQPAFNDWAFNLPRGEALARQWALIPAGTQVLVTHGPPAGLGDGGGVGYGGAHRRGCADLLARVEAVHPLLHLFGHIHDSGGFWRAGPTAFANVTTWECQRPPTVIDLDVAAGTVTPVEVPPAGS
jgi:predicted phosphodiesterase